MIRKMAILAMVAFSLAGCDDPSRNEQPNLHWAALMGDEALVRKLLQEGANKDEVDSHGHATPMGVAADAGHIRIVAMLIEAGADVNKKCPLYYAAQRGNVEIVKLLLKSGADPERYRIDGAPTPLLAACREGHLDVVKILSPPGTILPPVSGDINILMEAAANGHASVVEYLLGQGMFVNAQRSSGMSALHLAAWRGYLSTVRVLLLAGARLDLKTNDGLTPLDLALQEKHWDVAALLRAHQQLRIPQEKVGRQSASKPATD
jgi:ankyrin repeat protein